MASTRKSTRNRRTHKKVKLQKNRAKKVRAKMRRTAKSNTLKNK